MLKSYREVINTITHYYPLMVEKLHQFCEINTGTSNLKGLALMATSLQEAYKPLADNTKRITLNPVSMFTLQGNSTIQHYGDALFISKRPELKRRILLTGHMDTVYAATNPFQKITYVSDNHVNGPGVSDMKGGLIVMLYALMAFENTDSAPLMGWDVLINADEEIGSLGSAALLDELASNYQAALVYEPTMTPSGTLAKNRRGSGKFTVIARGKSAHVGRAFDEGRNAICYLADVVSAIHALNGQREGITINVGKIAGGEALNVVPNQAVAQLDVRISSIEDQLWIKQQFNELAKHLARKDYSLEFHGDFTRPVKRVGKNTERLFARLQSIGASLGMAIDWKDSGGCCDGNNLAQHGLAVLDTLGVRGGAIHSSDEYILLDSLTERASLSALLLMDLAQGGLEDLKNDAISSCA